MKKQLISMAAVALFTAVIVVGALLVGMNLSGSPPTSSADVEPMTTATEEPAVAEIAPTMAIAETAPTTALAEAAPPEPLPPEVPKTIAIPGYAQLVMNAGDIMQHIQLHNPSENPCYFVISIILPDGAEVFRSGLLKPGQKIDAVRLTQALEAGTYADAVLRYSCYSTEDKSPMNGADTKFTLEVV